MSDRKLTAALACRVQGTRLYGKPMQNLEPGAMILDFILAGITAAPEISTAVLGIAEGSENLCFANVAEKHGAGHIFGDEKDVLKRLIQCGRAAGASDVFRITTECPFICWEALPEAWSRHVVENRDITTVDHVSEGVGFEIYRLDVLERCWDLAADDQRSEYANNYPRTHQNEFNVLVIKPEAPLDRMDFRLTVDYPEDLVVCRKIYAALKKHGSHIPLSEIYAYCDANPELMELVSEYAVPGLVWEGVGADVGLSEKI